MKATEADLRQFMANVFGLGPDQIGEDASIDTIEACDSLKDLNLVFALEEWYGVEPDGAGDS